MFIKQHNMVSLSFVMMSGLALVLVLYFLLFSVHQTGKISFAQQSSAIAAINTISVTTTAPIRASEQEHEVGTSSYTQGYSCISTNSTNYNNGNWLNVCKTTYNFQTCQGNPQSGCPSADGYPDEDCGWPVGKMGVMCFSYGANPPFGTQGYSTNTCDGINEGISDTC